MDQKEYRCPKCNGSLYDRRRNICGWCGASIPQELLFTKEEIAKLDKEMAELDEERRQRNARQDKEEEERRRNGGGYLSG